MRIMPTQLQVAEKDFKIPVLQENYNNRNNNSNNNGFNKKMTIMTR